MKKKRIYVLAGIVLIATQLAPACSLYGDLTNKGGTEQITLTVWKPFSEEDSFRSIFEEYRKSHQNIQFQFVRKDIATYEQDLLNALAAGGGPDIFSIHNDWLPRYKDKLTPAPEGIYSLRQYQETFVDVAKEDFYDTDGRLYAVPFSVDVLALYYNRDLLGSVGIPQPPKTWNEAIQDSKKLTRQDKLGNFIVNGIALGTSGNINRSTDILSLLMLQNGTQIYNPSRSQATLDREVVAPDGTRYFPGPQAIEFYTQFANPAKETYAWNSSNNYSIDAFVSGQAAMILSYSYLAPTIRSKAPLLNFGVAPVPQIDASKPKVNFANYFGEAVSRQSPHAAEAWDFLKFMTQAENLQKYYSINKVPSSRKDFIATQISDPEMGVFAEGALTAKTFFKPDAAKVEAIFTRTIDDVILRGKTPQEAASGANQLLGDLLH